MYGSALPARYRTVRCDVYNACIMHGCTEKNTRSMVTGNSVVDTNALGALERQRLSARLTDKLTTKCGRLAYQKYRRTLDVLRALTVGNMPNAEHQQVSHQFGDHYRHPKELTMHTGLNVLIRSQSDGHKDTAMSQHQHDAFAGLAQSLLNPLSPTTSTVWYNSLARAPSHIGDEVARRSLVLGLLGHCDPHTSVHSTRLAAETTLKPVTALRIGRLEVTLESQRTCSIRERLIATFCKLALDNRTSSNGDPVQKDRGTLYVISSGTCHCGKNGNVLLENGLQTCACSVHCIYSLPRLCGEIEEVLTKARSRETKELPMLLTFPEAKLKSYSVNAEATASQNFTGSVEHGVLYEVNMASTTPLARSLEPNLGFLDCALAFQIGMDYIIVPQCRMYNRLSEPLDASILSSDHALAALLYRSLPASGEVRAYFAYRSSGLKYSQQAGNSNHVPLYILLFLRKNTGSVQKICIDVLATPKLTLALHWSLKDCLLNLQQRACSLPSENILRKELGELLCTGSDHAHQNKKQYYDPCEDTNAVLTTNNVDTGHVTPAFCEPCSDYSLVANAGGSRRVEPLTDPVSIEVHDEDVLQEYFDVWRAERSHIETAKSLDEKRATSTALFGTSRNSAGDNHECETESRECKVKAVASKGNDSFIFSGCTRDRTPYELILYPESLLPDRQSVSVVAYPIYSVCGGSLLKQLLIAPRESKSEFDVFRLASFDTWPHLGNISALRCCSAGFCRAANGGAGTSAADDLACVSCGCTVSRWTPGVDPLALHYGKCGQHCSFVAGLPRTTAASNGIAIDATSAAEIRDAKRSVSTVSRSVNCTKSNAVQSQIAVDWLSSIGLVPLTRKSAESLDAYSSAAMAVAACGSAMVRQPRATSSSLATSLFDGSTPAQDKELAKSESYRLSTFADVWASYDHIVDARELAKNGFLYAGPGDRVQCVFCLGLLRNWELGDLVDEQHAQHFTYCRFVQGHDVGNVPVPFWPLETKRSSDLQSPADATDGRGAELGISCAVPKNSDFAVEARRLLSFATWPTNHHMQPDILAKAGFFYLGKEDAVQCFFCEGTVVDWRTGCDPWVEHAQRFPDCSFLLQVQGHDFISRYRVDGGQATSRTKTIVSLAVDPREVRARIDSSKARILLRMDYPLDLVREVIQKRLATIGSDHETSEHLLDDIFHSHDEKQRASAARNASGCRLTPAVEPVFSSHQRWETSTKQQQASRLTTATATVPCAVAASAPKVSDANGLLANNCAPLTADRMSLAPNVRSDEENRQLKTQLTCKVCMDELVGIVFLPCGHLVCCVECAPALKACPICRVSIRGTVRTKM